MGFTDYLAEELLDHVWGGADYARPATLYVALYTGKAWAAETPFSEGDYAIPLTYNGRVYKCTTAGTSGASEPSWTTTKGGTVSDGTVTWTEQSLLFQADTMPTEVAEVGYRLAVTNNDTNWPAADNRTKANGVALSFDEATEDWGTVIAFAIRDASSAGNNLGFGALQVAKTIGTGDTATFAIGALEIEYL